MKRKLMTMLLTICMVCSLMVGCNGANETSGAGNANGTSGANNTSKEENQGNSESDLWSSLTDYQKMTAVEINGYLYKPFVNLDDFYNQLVKDGWKQNLLRGEVSKRPLYADLEDPKYQEEKAQGEGVWSIDYKYNSTYQVYKTTVGKIEFHLEKNLGDSILYVWFMNLTGEDFCLLRDCTVVGMVGSYYWEHKVKRFNGELERTQYETMVYKERAEFFQGKGCEIDDEEGVAKYTYEFQTDAGTYLFKYRYNIESNVFGVLDPYRPDVLGTVVERKDK